MDGKNNLRYHKKNPLQKKWKYNNQSDYYLNGGGDLPGPGGPQINPFF
jgi:hypothetical protein